jgi:hypothetical protein
MRRLGMAPSAGLVHAHRIVGEHEKSLAAFAAVGIIHRRDAEIAEKKPFMEFPNSGGRKRKLKTFSAASASRR